MPRFGSDRQYVSTNLSSNTDAGGNAIISPDNGFGGSPLGPAAVAQSLYAIPNPLFNLTPPDVLSAVGPDNQIPYWQFSNYSNSMSGSMIYDSTAQTWAARLDPGTASVGEYITLRTRSYLINDSNLNLRQKALATITKVGTYSSTNQWNLVLTASYYDVTGTQLHTYAIGTAADNGTWTAITGNTTSGGTAVAAAAAYVDLDFTLTAAATVSGTAKVDIESLLLATSTTATGAFLVSQTFNSSGTFTRPTGVSYVDVVAVGAGGGGARGGAETMRSTTGNLSAVGGAGGGSGRWAILRSIYIGDVSTVSIGIGAGGAGVAGSVATKASASATVISVSNGTASSGGATTFGSYLSVPGGGGGTTTAGGGAGGTVTAGIYGVDEVVGAAGASAPSAAGASSGISAYTLGAPFTTFVSGGTAQAGKTGSFTGGLSTTSSAGGAGGTASGLSGSGASGASATQGGGAAGTAVTAAVAGGTATSGGSGGGAGAGALYASASGTYTATGGAGGTALTNSGSGGGGGGGAHIKIGNATNYDSSTLTLTAGAGGAGAAGFVVISWVA
jgi:hypothetical protein